MSGLIMVDGQESASNADLLSSTLLSSIPANGILMFEFQNSDNDATNFGTIAIQLPDNSQPLNGVRIPTGAVANLAGVIDEREALKLRFRITQGGTCLAAYVETATCIMTWRCTFKPY